MLQCEILQLEQDIELHFEHYEHQYSEKHLSMDKQDITDELLDFESLLLVI